MTRLASLAPLVLALSSLAGCGNDDDGGPTPVDASMDAGGTDGAIGEDAGGTDGGGTDAAGDDGGGGEEDGGPVSMPCTAMGDCDPFDPTACPDGEACHPNPSGTECAELTARTVGEGEECSARADCAPGLLCLDFGDGFSCNRMCPEGSIGFCGEDKGCFGTIGDAGVRICRPIPEPCDIYAQDCPDPDDTCTFTRDPETDEPYTGCRPAGEQGHGEPCGGDDGSCDRGLVCIRGGDGSTSCHHVCDPDGEPDCTAGDETCDGFAETWMVGYCR